MRGKRVCDTMISKVNYQGLCLPPKSRGGILSNGKTGGNPADNCCIKNNMQRKGDGLMQKMVYKLTAVLTALMLAGCRGLNGASDSALYGKRPFSGNLRESWYA